MPHVRKNVQGSASTHTRPRPRQGRRHRRMLPFFRRRRVSELFLPISQCLSNYSLAQKRKVCRRKKKQLYRSRVRSHRIGDETLTDESDDFVDKAVKYMLALAHKIGTCTLQRTAVMLRKGTSRVKMETPRDTSGQPAMITRTSKRTQKSITDQMDWGN